ncbi:hypothetical protein [Micromonospora rhizosphaerae]|uniref:hypothetical protein n=1 Tax=Micromonospora rhizosphaerae TaxID=568872 RepID=UPI00159F2E38|nr:hypothetical protein [Micromonospora rhizosphaerae]
MIHDDGPDYILERVRMYYDGRGGQGSPFDAVPFRPIDLRPDDEIVVYLTLRLAEVPNETCAGFQLYSQRVRFKVLGIPREQLVPIGHVISVLTPTAASQPCAAETWKLPRARRVNPEVNRTAGCPARAQGSLPRAAHRPRKTRPSRWLSSVDIGLDALARHQMLAHVVQHVRQVLGGRTVHTKNNFIGHDGTGSSKGDR